MRTRRFVHHTKRLARRERRRFHRLRKHPFVVPVTTFLVLFFLTAALFIGLSGSTVGASDSRLVQVAVDGQVQTVPTRAQTVGDLLSRLNITLNEQDLVEPTLDTPIIEDDFRVNVYRAHPVTIVDGSKSLTTLTPYQEPRIIAEKAVFSLMAEDSVTFEQPDLKAGVIGQKVAINRATPIIINLYGTAAEVRTLGKTVGEALKDKSIQTLPGDTVSPALETPLVPGLQIFIVRIGKQVVTVEEAIPMPVETISDPAVPFGTTVVRQAGTPGKKLVTYEIETHNGAEVGRRVLQEVIASQPSKQVVARGTKVSLTGSKSDWLAASVISSSDYYAVDYIMAHESSWRPNAISANRCIGLGQSCGGALANACPNWASDPVCQLNFFDRYAKGRYGSWSKAYDWWTVNRWW
jgi:uncharacterized protein YabE (DUF348 family)